MAFTDDFTGTSGDYLSARSGWTLVTGTAGSLRINSSNQLYAFSSAESLHTCTNQGSADCYLQWKQVNTAGTSSFICIRVSTINGFISARYNSNANGWQIYKRTGSATFTSLGSYVPGSTSGTDVGRIEANGNSIVLKVNGTTQISVTETYNNTETEMGLVNRTDAPNPWIDDFEAGVLSAGGSVSRSLSDTVIVNDSDTTTAERFRSILDAASAVDTVARLIQASRLRTDEATTTDAASRNLRSSRLLMDSASVYDALSAAIQYAGQVVVSRILNDSITVEEALVRLARITRQRADIVPISDTALSSKEIARRLVEDVLALDVQLRSVLRGRTLSEVLPIYDAAVRAVIIVRLRDELVNVADSLVTSNTVAPVVSAAINILMSVFTQEPIIMTIESEPIEMEVLL